MKTLAATLAMALTVATTIPLATTAEAAAPPRVEGYHCPTLAAMEGAANVWHTSFRGQKEDLFDRIDRFVASPCFRTEAECKAWLYWAQTDWPDRNSFRPCAKGWG